MRQDVVILGGGAAGLWLLAELVDRGCRAVLLEAAALGSGQTIASQGIIHGGLKYSLQGWLTPSASEVREMPLLWKACLAGRQAPILRNTHVRSSACYLWRTDSVSSRLAMIGARWGLRVQPRILASTERPALLAECPGAVAYLEEPVISPASFLADLAEQYRERILKIDIRSGLEWVLDGPGHVKAIRLFDGQLQRQLILEPRYVVLAAGAGNAEVRQSLRLSAAEMQRRPLHMVLLRGRLPEFAGHCVDGSRTRVTITSDVDSFGRTVWQVGGQVAEDGVLMDASSLIAHTAAELKAVIPGIDLTNVEWTTYRVDRAERATSRGKRPASAQLIREGNCVTGWPTKLALAPQFAHRVTDLLNIKRDTTMQNLPEIGDWSRPQIALPPWETDTGWCRNEDVSISSKSGGKAA